MLRWDGSDIADIVAQKNVIIHEAMFEGETVFWRLNIWDESKEKWYFEYCTIRSVSNISLCCFLDEIKPIFGLEKTGTHRLKFKNKDLVLYKCNEEKGNIVTDFKLSLLEKPGRLKDRIRKVFVFRDLLKITKTYESSIVIRKEKLKTKILSFYEPGVKPDSDKILPDTVLEKWFNEASADEILKEMTGVEDADGINPYLSEIKTRLERVCLRIDPDLIIMVDEIISRLRSKLQFLV